MATLELGYQRRWRLTRKIAGTCYDCPKPAMSGRSRCYRCLRDKSQRDARYRGHRRAGLLQLPGG